MPNVWVVNVDVERGDYQTVALYKIFSNEEDAKACVAEGFPSDLYPWVRGGWDQGFKSLASDWGTFSGDRCKLRGPYKIALEEST